MESFLSLAIAKSRSSSEISTSSEEAEQQPTTCQKIPERLEARRYGWKEIHGFRGNKNWSSPLRLPDHFRQHSALTPPPTTLKQKEYEDEPYVFHQKVKLLAQLVLSSRQCCVYAGKLVNDKKEVIDNQDDIDTFRKGRSRRAMLTHHALVALQKVGHVKYLVQQNHDGIFQKCGFPQHKLNEIHGSIYDPSNPVVLSGEALRLDLFRDLLEWENFSDLIIRVGTSNYGGHSSDRLFRGISQRGIQGTAIGGVVIGLHKTNYDQLAALKIFAKSDDVMEALLQQLKIDLHIPNNFDAVRYKCTIPKACVTSMPDVFLLPYDRSGNKLPEENSCVTNNRNHTGRSDIDPDADGCQCYTTLDLREGAAVTIMVGPHLNSVGRIVGKTEDGHYCIEFSSLCSPDASVLTKTESNIYNTTINENERKEKDVKYKKKCLQDQFNGTLGLWWIESASRGELSCLPVTNLSPTQL